MIDESVIKAAHATVCECTGLLCHPEDELHLSFCTTISGQAYDATPNAALYARLRNSILSYRVRGHTVNLVCRAAEPGGDD